jgi:hypothetical protein
VSYLVIVLLAPTLPATLSLGVLSATAAPAGHALVTAVIAADRTGGHHLHHIHLTTAAARAALLLRLAGARPRRDIFKIVAQDLGQRNDLRAGLLVA